MSESAIISESTKIKAEKIIRENFEYLDEVVEATIVNILEDMKIEEVDNNFVAELQHIRHLRCGKKIWRENCLI